MGESSNLAVIGILASCVGALVWIIKYLFAKIIPNLEKNTDMLKLLADVTTNNTAATKSADEYLRERNGRDIEFHTQVVERLDAVPLKMEQIALKQAKELKRITMQDVKEQTVQHQTVANKEEI